MKIAIIGMGVAGISVLREWTKEQQHDPSIHLTVFGDKETFGTGKGYQPDDLGLLMNQAAEFTSLIPEDDDDFVKWMRENYGEKDPAMKFYPRSQFGEYVHDRMNDWLFQSKADVILEKVEAMQMLPNHRFRVSWPSGEADFDAVHLCMGNLPYQDPYHIKDHPHTIGDPVPIEEQLANLPDGASIGVLGMGLTGVDIFRYTFAHRPDVDVSFFSRSGTFKTIIHESIPVENRFFTKENIARVKEMNHGIIPLDTHKDWFIKELEHYQVSLDNVSIDETLGSKESIQQQLTGSREIAVIQAVLKNITLLQTDLWAALMESDKHAFMKKYYKTWDKLRAPFPHETGEDLVYAWEKNVFSVYDNLDDIEENGASFTCHLKDGTSINVDYFINATGNDIHVSFDKKQMPLLSQMLNERIIQPEEFG